MNVWRMTKWRKFYNSHPCRSGLRVDFEKNVHPEVKRAIKEFVAWLRSEYVFPKRIRMYVKAAERIKAMDGDMVYGTLFQPFDRNEEPYAKIATGDYLDLVQEDGVDNALAKILGTIAHELTHFFQWLNDIKLTEIGEERQANNYSDSIIFDYSETREHP